MTLYVEYELRCDGAAGPYDCEPAVYALTAAEARRLAREDGWLVASPRGKDYCAQHRQERTGGARVSDLNYLSLFSGIGGLDLGLDRAGWNCVAQVELDAYCRSVLELHWPEVPRHDDVRTAPEWWRSEPRPAVRLVAGGFPCQPFSTAGLGLGIEPTDEMKRAYEIRDDAAHAWEDVYWATGRWRGHKASQRLCSKCGLWETRRNSEESCRGKHWEDLTDQEKSAAFGAKP